MRILHVGEVIRGGVGTYLNVIVPPQIEQYGSSNVRVLVPSRFRADVRLPDEVVITSTVRGRSPDQLLTLMRDTGRLVSGFRPQVIHAHSSFPGFLVRTHVALGGARPARPAVVYTPHGWSFLGDSGRGKRWAYGFAERVLARFTDSILCISEHERSEAMARGMRPRRLDVARNAIPLKPMAQWTDRSGPIRLLFVGRLDRQKGFDLLLEALRRLERGRFDLRVVGEVVVGGGTTPGAAAMADLRGDITMLGWQSPAEVEAMYEWCDAVVVPSRWEGLPLVVLEAMRAGRGVIATDCGAVTEAVADGKTGLIVPVGDVEAFAAALGSVSRETLREMGAAGRARFLEEFRLERLTRQLHSLYSELTDEA